MQSQRQMEKGAESSTASKTAAPNTMDIFTKGL